MTTTIRQLALFVPDLRAAEAYYQHLFDMEIIGREAPGRDGLSYTLPPDKRWEDAEAAGVKIAMLALRRGGLVLALFPGDPQPGQIKMIGLNMPRQEIAALRGRLPEDTLIWEDRPDALTFRDRYLITWQIYVTGTEFQSSGQYAGRWLEV